jgi:hypothetical protein
LLDSLFEHPDAYVDINTIKKDFNGDASNDPSTLARHPNSTLHFKGSLVDPRLRASNEHILIVRVPRAGGRSGCPPLFYLFCRSNSFTS